MVRSLTALSLSVSVSPYFALTRLPKEEVESLSKGKTWLTKQRIAAFGALKD